MFSNRKVQVYMIAATLTLLPTVSAHAACSLPGTWYFYTGDGEGMKKCLFKVEVDGSVTGDCTGFSASEPAGTTRANTGHFAVDAACNLTGNFRAVGRPVVQFRGAHINGPIGGGIATTGTTLFTSFMLVKR